MPWADDGSSEEESRKDECYGGAGDAGSTGESSIEANRNLAKYCIYGGVFVLSLYLVNDLRL